MKLNILICMNNNNNNNKILMSLYIDFGTKQVPRARMHSQRRHPESNDSAIILCNLHNISNELKLNRN